MVLRSDFDTQIKKLEKDFTAMQYRQADLKNMNLTTDQYIDKFLPFRVAKDMTKILCFVHEDDEELALKAKLYEKDTLKNLYMYLCSNEHQESSVEFKSNLIMLNEELKSEFESFDVNHVQLKKDKHDFNQTLKLQQHQVSNSFKELRMKPSAEKMYSAIEIMAGSTDMNPTLSRKIHEIEEEMKKAYVFITEMKQIVARTLDDDGDLNVKKVQKELHDIKQWVSN